MSPGKGSSRGGARARSRDRWATRDPEAGSVHVPEAGRACSRGRPCVSPRQTGVFPRQAERVPETDGRVPETDGRVPEAGLAHPRDRRARSRGGLRALQGRMAVYALGLPTPGEEPLLFPNQGNDTVTIPRSSGNGGHERGCREA